MILLSNSSTDPWLNLASEEYLLKEKKEEYVMIWQNDPAVIVGRHQDLKSETDVDYTIQEKIKLCRRYSGGGAVYQDKGNINLTFICNGAITGNRKYTAEIVKFLRSLHLHVETDSRQSITLNSLKISGCAQSIYKNRWLHHATLLFDSDLEKLKLSLNPTQSYTPKSKRVRSVKSPVTNIRSWMPVSINTEKFMELLQQYFISGGLITEQRALTPFDMEKSRELKTKKYATESWITKGITR